MIILDEENDSSYKSSQSPRYHARQVAYMRVLTDKALFIMGSATPSVESYYFALNRKFSLYRLEERYNKNPLPVFKIIDLQKKENFSRKYPLTEELILKVNQNIEKSQQVMLFINRRGFSNYMTCESCGQVINCPKCNISLTYHKTSNALTCHYCGFKKAFQVKCEYCGSETLTHGGAGTQKIEDIIKEIFHQKTVSRLDLDVSRRKGKLRQIIRDFERNNINILTGTQIISKGLNFPNVTLVGILYIDDLLNLPDFRSAEHVFELIVQVSGRAGRDKHKGEVLIQTYLMDHYAIKYATTYQFEQFYKEEIDLRKQLHYPPFYRLIKITFEGREESDVEKTALKIYTDLKRECLSEDVELLGPISAPISKIKEKYRYQILIKTKEIKKVRQGLMKIKRKYKSINVIIDVDPISLL